MLSLAADAKCLNCIGLEGFRQIGSFIVVSEQLIVCVQYVDVVSE